MWYINKMECYSAIGKNEIMPFVATWMNLEIITLREVSPTDKNIMAYVEFEKKDTNKLMVSKGNREGTN